ncbi:MAG TPA: hypothetical protein VN026_15960 [Bacteroidia bacterium]|jgi:hypothetical protein|nr:hypothetical protein [Bacteroidia bacterium]
MTTGKKILILAGIGAGVYAIFGYKSGWDGKTIWQRYFGKPNPSKQPIKVSSADGDSSCGCGCKDESNISNERTFNQKNIRTPIK